MSTRRVHKYTLLVLLCILAALPLAAYALKTVILVGEQTLWVPGVYIAPNGSFIGLPSKLEVRAIYPGRGDVYFSTQPLTRVDTQAAARIAALIASLYAGTDPLSVDWLVSLESNTTTIGGPSASAATALAMYAVLTGRKIPHNISLTGMIDIDGSIGPVGGIVAKLRAMSRIGIKTFFIPAGEEISYEIKRVIEHKDGVTIERETRIPVNVTILGEKLGVKVIPVSSFAELIERVFKVRIPSVNPSLPKALQVHLQRIAKIYLREAKENLTLAKQLYSKYSGQIDQQILSAIKRLMQEAENNIKRGREALASKKYYVAASSAFAAAIEAGQARLLLEAIKEFVKGANMKSVASSIVDTLLDRASHVLNTAEKRVKELIKLHDANALQIAIAVYNRIIEAYDTINTTRQRLALGDWFHSILNAVYAYYRARTALDWLEAYKLIGRGPSYDVERLLKTVRVFASYAEMLDTYLTNIGIMNEFVSTARNYLDIATSLLSQGAPPEEVLAPTITSIVYYVLALHAQYGTASSLYNASRSMALYAYTIVARQGVTPILAASYIEAGDNMSDALAKIDFYSRAAITLLVLYTILYKGHPPPVVMKAGVKLEQVKEAGNSATARSVQENATETRTTTNRTSVTTPASTTAIPSKQSHTKPSVNTVVSCTSGTCGAGLSGAAVLVAGVILAGIIAGIASIVAYAVNKL